MAVTKPSTIAAKRIALNQLGNADSNEAVVVKEEHTTTTYKAPAPKDYEKNSEKNSSENNSKQSQTSNDSDEDTFVHSIKKEKVRENRLAAMFEELKEIENEPDEIFYALITRKQDMMQDNFRVPCLANQSFPVMQLTSKMLFQFVPLIQKSNGNSGGRFDITICDAESNFLEIGLNNFVISNPVIEDKENTSSTPNDKSLDVLTLFERMNEASEKRFQQMLDVMRPTEDEFTKLAKEKLRNDILSPQSSKFNPEEIMSNVMGSIAVTQAMADAMSKSFNRESAEKDKGLLETLLTNEIFLEKAQNVYERTTEVIADIVISKQNPLAYAAQRQAEYAETEPYPPLPPSANNTSSSEVNDIDMERQQQIRDILNELDSERPLDDTNQFLLKLKNENLDLYNILVLSCKALPFHQLASQLESIVPDVFQNYSNEAGELTEDGLRLLKRLETFYNFMKSQS